MAALPSDDGAAKEDPGAGFLGGSSASIDLSGIVCSHASLPLKVLLELSPLFRVFLPLRSVDRDGILTGSGICFSGAFRSKKPRRNEECRGGIAGPGPLSEDDEARGGMNGPSDVMIV